ncbi:MAG: D-alanyl-D-alanine carboxypeptidase family protein [Azospirillaceae bacterium]
MKLLATPRRAAALAFVLLLGLVGQSAAQSIETRAREAIVIDMTSGTVLLEHNADDRMPTASMSKLMTMYMVFEALQSGRISLDDRLPVSERAWQMEGSRMFVEVGDQVRVEDLVRGVVVQSGNDASVVFAEALGGTEAEFARQMTERARELGLENSNFMNATGLPHEDHYSTPRDLALLAQRIIEDFPDLYGYYAETEFTWNDITQGNRNPLLYRDIGADGLKTGHTEEAGYGMVGSAVRGDRRVIIVVGGLESAQARADESARLIEWAFREFDTFSLFEAGEAIAHASVWQGEPAAVPMVVAEDLVVTLNRASWDDVSLRAVTQEPLATPVVEGQEIGMLVISAPGMPDNRVPLLAGAASDTAGFLSRVTSGLGHMARSVID